VLVGINVAMLKLETNYIHHEFVFINLAKFALKQQQPTFSMGLVEKL
jgi:hypothetical protein